MRLLTLLLAIAWHHNNAAHGLPSDSDIAKFVQRLWRADENGAKDGEVVMNLQGKTSFKGFTDTANGRLFVSVADSLLRRPTYKTMIDLSKEYKEDTGVDDQSQRQKQKADAFLDAVLATKVMKMLREFMQKNGVEFAPTEAQFREQLKTLWFTPYSRSRGVPGTSGFEHVFVGENDGGEIKGMHNWVRFYMLEKEQGADYAGYTKKGDHIISIKYRHNGKWKSSSMFVRTSPELELALYTLCYTFREGKNKCRFELPDCTQVQATTYEHKYRGSAMVGSAYPAAKGNKQCLLYGGSGRGMDHADAASVNGVSLVTAVLAAVVALVV